MVNRTILVALVAAFLSAGAATGATWMALHGELCTIPPGPDATELQRLQKQHDEFFKSAPLDNTHGQEMKPRW